MKLKFSHFLCLIILFNLTIPVNSNIEPQRSIWAETEIAFYADLDLDGLEDDIHVVIDVSLANVTIEELNNGIFYGIYFTLVLPSGYTYYYLIHDYATSSNFDIFMNLLNHATEPGWYDIYVAATFDQFGSGNTIQSHFYRFDPPDGGSGGEPMVVAWK